SLDDSDLITISKVITIDCAGTSATAGGIAIGTAGIVVLIRNLGIILGGGITFTNGATLIVENCVLSENFNGIVFQPATAEARLFVTDTLIQNSGSGANGAGIFVSPQGAGSARVVLDRVRVENNVTGIFLSTPAGSNGIQLAIQDSNVSGNNFTGFFSL